MFFKKRKKKKEKEKEEVVEQTGVLEKGQRTVKDLMAPSSFDRSNPDYFKAGNKYVKSYVLDGYPTNVYVGWLRDLYDYNGDMDTAVHIQPADHRIALEEITNDITKYETQLLAEKESGKITNITKLENTVRQLYAERGKIERDEENLFHIQVFANLYADSEDELDKKDEMLNNRLKGKKIELMSPYLRQDESYKNALPFAKVYTDDRFRNLNSGAVTSLFPFYNSEISHEDGIFAGINMEGRTPSFIDFYNRDVLRNSNFTIFGASGSGKTYAVSTFIIRSAFKGVRTAIVDPEGEFRVLTQALGGSHLYIAPGSDTRINPFDLEEEDETDDNGKPTGRKALNVKEKVADVLNLIGVMAGGLTREQESLTSIILDQTFKDFGFTDDPNSLYVVDSMLDERTKEFYHHGDKKPMPTFSDFHDRLRSHAEESNNSDLISLANSLEMFKRDGINGMFDGQSSTNVDFTAPIITFDVSDLEEGTMRPIGMFVALSWIWEKFVKKDPEIKKKVICDEAWMLVNKHMTGYEYTANFLDKASRRIRKRNGGLGIVSQNFREFDNSEQGKAVLTNSSVNFFLAQASTDIDALQNRFKLSDGEKNFLYTARRGEALVKIGKESSVMQIIGFNHEHYLITGKHKS